MPKICGELKQLAAPEGGGFIHTSDRDDRGNYRAPMSFKQRMVFPYIRIGDRILERLFVASDQLGHELADGLRVGQHVCLFTYGHLLRKQVIIGARADDGTWIRMPAKGLVGGLLWYVIFSPMFLAIPAVLIGMVVGSIGGRLGTAYGLLLGTVYALGISWFSAYRFVTAYREMGR